MNFLNCRIENVCRTCVNEGNKLSKIEETNISFENTTKPVLEILNLITVIENNENLPYLICLNCVDKVTDIFKFKLQCDNSNALLEQYVKTKVEVDDYESKESINDNVEREEIRFDNNVEQVDNFNTRTRVKREKIELKIPSDSENEEDINDDFFFCEICSKSFKTKSILILHEKRHKQKQKLMCEICNKKFTSKGCLDRHNNETHHDIKNELESVDNTEEINPYTCNICSKTLKSKYILTVHKKRHLLKGQFLCTTCGKGFNSKGCLNRHMRVHTGEKKYECSVCKKKFPSSNNLNLHFRIHSGVKPYLCTICGKSFTHPTGLTYHVRTHTKEKNYRCDMCGKSFAIQCHLDNHRKIHTGERPFACSQCEKAFIKKIDLQRHESVHTGVKPYICAVCDKEFLRLLHLNYHMMIHTEERPHKCSYCGKGFIRRYYLKDHMMKHHGVRDIPRMNENEILDLV